MSESEDDDPVPSMEFADYSDDDDGPSTSWGLKRRNKCPVISDSDDDDDLGEEVMKDDGESGDSDSSEDTPGAKTCAICLGRMRGEVASPDACEHTFCKFCLLEWAKNNPTCPQDRIAFTLVLVRKRLGEPICKELPIPKGPAPDVYEFVEIENPTYCEVCNQCDREESLLLCDGCDLGYHLECLDPPLTQVPVEEWFCPVCVAVDVPETLAHRLSSSSRRSRARRSTSRSEGTPEEQQELRIPRTRATEIIRQRIQKKKHKKRLKRKKYKERKRERIASGEEEDNRKPVTQLAEFRYFIEGDNDIDAEHTEDKYADQLLAGTTHESARFPAQRKANAARRLRDIAFTPHVAYSGRVKNKVLEVVSTQSEDTDNDLLSGILENQAIAFSSSKKIVLTSDRKLAKQPDAQFSCDIFQETTSLMTEPLPSQRKSPEKESLASSSNENSSSVIPKEHKEDDSGHDEQSASSDRQKNLSKSSHYHSSSKDDHRKSRNPHHYSSYSHHDRHSSQRNYSHYEPSCSYARHDRSYSSHRWKEKRDYKGYHDRHESYEKSHSRDRSPHRRSKSPWREKRRDRSPGASFRYGRSRDHKTHYSQSNSPHSRSKKESSHSLSRSQWSFNYFNANDNMISKSSHISKDHSVIAGIGDQSNLINDKTIGEKNYLNVQLSDKVLEMNGRHSRIDALQEQNPSQAKICLGAEEQSQKVSFDHESEILLNSPKKCPGNEEQPQSTNAESTLTPKEEKQDQNKGNECEKESRTDEDISLELPKPVYKKAKISALFGDMKGEEKICKRSKKGKTKSETKIMLKEDHVNYSKVSKKSKSEVLFGYDSDVNSDSDVVLRNSHEIRDYRTEQNHSKNVWGTEGNKYSNFRNLANDASDCEAEEYDPLRNICSSTNHEPEVKLSKSVKYSKSAAAHIEMQANTGVELISGEKHNKEVEKGSKICEKEKEAKQSRTYSTAIDELQKEYKDHKKFSSRKDSHLTTYKTHQEKENKSSLGSNSELNKISDKCSTKEKKFKPDNSRNAKDESNSDLHDKREKDVEIQNHRNQKMEWESSISDRSEASKKVYENLSYKIRESDGSGKCYSKEKEIDVIERHHTKDREKRRKETEMRVRNRKEVEIPDKYKDKLSHLEQLISIDNGTEFWERHSFGNGDVAKVESSKNNGVGRKSSSKSLFICDKRNENKDSIKVKDKMDDSVSGHSKHGTSKQEMCHIIDSALKTSKEKSKLSKEEKKKGSHVLSDLFGDIDDLGSSSCSNVPEFEVQQQSSGIDTSLRVTVKDENNCLSFEGKIKNPKDLLEVTRVICNDTSNSVLGGKDVCDEADDRGLTVFRCTQVTKDKTSSILRNDTGYRNKQQKAILEARVVEVVKKSLDPFYRNKSITKDEYKQIVAKCVKKVVSAECGDVIEPEKMHTLVLGYIRVFRHRQSKTHV